MTWAWSAKLYSSAAASSKSRQTFDLLALLAPCFRVSAHRADKHPVCSRSMAILQTRALRLCWRSSLYNRASDRSNSLQRTLSSLAATPVNTRAQFSGDTLNKTVSSNFCRRLHRRASKYADLRPCKASLSCELWPFAGLALLKLSQQERTRQDSEGVLCQVSRTAVQIQEGAHSLRTYCKQDTSDPLSRHNL